MFICVHMYLYRKIYFIGFLGNLRKLICLVFLSDFFIECDCLTGVLNVRIRENNEKIYSAS